MVVGYEVSGTVEGIGSQVSGMTKGQLVLAPVFFGGYSTQVCVPSDQVFPLPKKMNCSEGAAIPVNYLTAFGMAMKIARLKAGDHVLIYSAAGGVGVALWDLCRIVGATAVGVASASKHEKLRERGFTQLVDARSANLDEKLKKLSREHGFDVIFDSRGGESWAHGLDLLAPFGKLIAFGFSSCLDEIATGKPVFSNEGTGLWYSADLFRLAQANISVSGFNLATFWKRSFSELRIWMEEILLFYRQGKLNITVDKEFSFNEAALAHQYIEERKNFGKVILVNT
jgi:NADPH:quinone reductase-like Zn-dependent oxidoreductase